MLIFSKTHCQNNSKLISTQIYSFYLLDPVAMYHCAQPSRRTGANRNVKLGNSLPDSLCVIIQKGLTPNENKGLASRYIYANIILFNRLGYMHILLNIILKQIHTNQHINIKFFSFMLL